MKRFLWIAVIFSIMSALSCRVYPETDGLIDWERVSRPGMDDVIVYDTREEAEAAGGGWFVTMNDTFDDNRLPEHWTTSPHGLRWKSQSSLHPEYANYWCPAMVSVKNGMVEILSGRRPTLLRGSKHGASLKAHRHKERLTNCSFLRRSVTSKRGFRFPLCRECGRLFGCNLLISGKSATAVKTARKSIFMNPHFPPKPISTAHCSFHKAAKPSIKTLLYGRTLPTSWKPTMLTRQSAN